MLWLIQKDLVAKTLKHNLIEVLQRLEINYLEIEVFNSTDYRIVSDKSFDPNDNIITNGSIALSAIAQKNNWRPGSFINDNFNYLVWSEHYRDFLLNKNSKIQKIKDIDLKALPDRFFARPVLDNKAFNGQVFDKEKFAQYQSNVLQKKTGFASPEIEVLISNPKTIGQEHRHFIVDGQIITSSRYKFNGQSNFKEGCDDRLLEVVQQCIDMWQPARAFVLDTYISGQEIGIVEIGGICHAGLYDCDLFKLVNALDSMNFEKKYKKHVS